MKANKITLIAQTVGMYVMHLPLYVLFFLGLFPAGESTEGLFNTLLTVSYTLASVVGLICIANIVLSVIAVFKGEVDHSKTVRNVKLALIPWYVMNFAMNVVIVAIFFNPFLMLGIPIVIALSMILSYFFLLGTSLPDVAYYFHKVFVKKEEKIVKPRVVSVVFLFIFCLDVIGGILFHRQNKQAAIPPIEENAPVESE